MYAYPHQTRGGASRFASGNVIVGAAFGVEPLPGLAAGPLVLYVVLDSGGGSDIDAIH